MAGAKEIRSKIASIKSTQKITSAMEKVAVSKMRKAQMRMAASRPYAERIRQVIGHLANANPEYRHPFMIDRAVKRVGYVVVSSDRGLCGGLNTNLFKALVKDMAVNRENGVEIDLCVVGSKGAAFFRNFGGNVVAAISHLGEEPSINDLIGSVKVMLDAYLEGRIDRLSVVSNKFINNLISSISYVVNYFIYRKKSDHVGHRTGAHSLPHVPRLHECRVPLLGKRLQLGL